MKSQCSDGHKNIFNARVDKAGRLVTKGEQVEVGAEDKYVSMSRRMYNTKALNQFLKKGFEEEINNKNL